MSYDVIKNQYKHPDAKPDCPKCAGTGYYQALDICEYDEIIRSVQCSCTVEVKEAKP